LRENHQDEDRTAVSGGAGKSANAGHAYGSTAPMHRQRPAREQTESR
jgi:hypothetical protein